MEIFYYRDPKLNFGDDLNEIIWRDILSTDFLSTDNSVMIGIGSILSEEWVGKYSRSGKHVIVLGSGTSYDRPPENMDDWSVLAVRGPLTAKLIGRPDAAITDGAILLADVVGKDFSQGGDDVIFMPHHRSIRKTRWQQITEAAGIRYVSPQQPVETILAAFARARLVITEAMHGAIVADTLRIPWQPVIISPGVDEFKWRDWCLSMGVPFQPSYLPSGDARDISHFGAMQAVLDDAGVGRHAFLAEDQSEDRVAKYFERRFSAATKSKLLWPPSEGRKRRYLARALMLLNPIYERKLSATLKALKAGPAFLSEDAVFADRLDRMRSAVGEAEAIAAKIRAC